MKSTYITKEGKQEFEAFQWINGENVYYDIPAGVKIINLCYRPTGYDTKITGVFESNNDFFNLLWKKSARTLYVNMHDTYMDCPNRERAQWSLDMALSMEEALYALDTNSYDLYKHGIKTLLGWKEGDTILSIAPNSLSPVQLPIQNLLLIYSLKEYYEYTGDLDFIKEIYPDIKNYLNLWSKNEYGMLQCHAYENLWEWHDSSEKLDYKQLEHVTYCLANISTKSMAEALKLDNDVNEYENRLNELKNDFNNYWTDSGYKSINSEYVDDRINALAVIAGIADKSKYDIILKNLTENYEASPAMEKYVLEALCIMGKEDAAQDRMRNQYFNMVVGENACSTLWEHWEYGMGSKNHAWSGGVLTIMSKYFAGIEPLEDGYKSVIVRPRVGKLDKIYAKVPTIKGDISLDYKKDTNIINIEVVTPVKTVLAIPKDFQNPTIKVNGRTAYKNNKAKVNSKCDFEKEDDEFYYFNLKKGRYVIVCKNK